MRIGNETVNKLALITVFKGTPRIGGVILCQKGKRGGGRKKNKYSDQKRRNEKYKNIEKQI
jgi:hypothetical protein